MQMQEKNIDVKKFFRNLKVFSMIYYDSKIDAAQLTLEVIN